MLKAFCGVALGLVVAGGLVAWQDAPPSRESLALELVQVLDLPNITRQAFDVSIEAQVKNNPALAPMKDVLLEWGHTFITWEAMEPKMVELYASAFTETELADLLAFYRTPTGAKSVTALPMLMQKGAEIGAALAEEHKAELQEMLAKPR